MAFNGQKFGLSKGTTILWRGSFLIASSDFFFALAGLIMSSNYLGMINAYHKELHEDVAIKAVLGVTVFLHIIWIVLSIILMFGLFRASSLCVSIWFWVNFVLISIAVLFVFIFSFFTTPQINIFALLLGSAAMYRSLQCWIVKELHWEQTCVPQEISMSYSNLRPESVSEGATLHDNVGLIHPEYPNRI